MKKKTASPQSPKFEAKRRRGSSGASKLEQRVREGKTIKDPAFKAMFNNALELERFLIDFHRKGLQLLAQLAPFCATGVSISKMALDFFSANEAGPAANDNDRAQVEKAKLYHATMASSLGTMPGGGFQNFVDDLENNVLLTLKLQLETIEQIKCTLVRKEELETLTLEQKKKLDAHVKQQLKKKKAGKKRHVNEQEWGGKLLLLQNEFDRVSEQFNETSRELFDELKELMDHKTDIVVASVEALKRAQLTLFSMLSAQMKGCVKDFRRYEKMSVTMSPEQVDRALAAAEYGPRSPEESDENSESRKSPSASFFRSWRKRKNSNTDAEGGESKCQPAQIKGDNENSQNAIQVGEVFYPANYRKCTPEKIEEDSGDLPAEVVEATDGSGFPPAIGRNAGEGSKDVASLTPMAQLWSERRSLESEHAERGTDGTPVKEESLRQIKEILSIVKEKYAEGLISKLDKNKVKQLLKDGKIRHASVVLGELLSNAISADGDIIVDKSKKKKKKEKKKKKASSS